MNNQDTAIVEETAAPDAEESSQAAAPSSSTEATESEAVSETPPGSDESTAQSEEPAPSDQVDSPSEATPTSEAEEPVSIHDLKPGRHIIGKVKNITNFGAFVDIGLPQDGLVHISELSRRKVGKVTDVVSVGQEIEVWVKKVDKKRGRISLTMVKPIARRLRDIKEGDEFEGVVTRLESYGAFVDIASDREGLVHISQITHDYINHPEEVLAVGDKVNVKVLKVNRKKRQVDLSIKALLPPPAPAEPEVVAEPQAPAEVEQEVQEESVPTAMALAYAAFQDEQQSDEPDEEETKAKNKARQKEELEAIIARTLAGRE